MIDENVVRRFKFDLELELGIYKVKRTENHRIVYFVLDHRESYSMLIELKKVLDRIGYRHVSGQYKNSNTIKVYLDRRNYRIVPSAPYFDSKSTPKNRFPDFIRESIKE